MVADTQNIVFELGEVRVVGQGSHPFTLTVEDETLQRLHKRDVASALARLPGLNLAQLGQKNEFMVNVRGFDLRQVPVYLDGVPVYVSYDGYADLSRFLVSDLSRITVTRGETSLLTGPNAMGGAINLVSRKPVSGFEFDAASGFTFDRRGYGGLQSEINLGSRKEKFYFQMGVSLVSLKSFVKSARADSIASDSGLVQHNSQQEDVNASLKFGITPNATDSYVVSYFFQDGSKGVPPYGGEDPGQRARYWQFPVIRKMGIHLNTKTSLGKRGYLQTRWFYDDYFNDLKSYDDSTYSTQLNTSSFTSIYDDETMGGTVIFSIKPWEKHELKAALHAIYDHHRENNIHPVEEQVRHFIDLTTSLALEDDYRITEKLRARIGAGFHLKNNLQADDYSAPADSVFSFPGHRDRSFNVLTGLRFDPREDHRLNANLSRKSRFPTMKDRYSYRLGKSIPNPDLLSESSWNLDVGYAYVPGSTLRFSTSLFFSRLQNTIQAVYGVDPDNSAVYQHQNTGNARYYGLETGFDWNPMEEIGFGIQYTFTERENLSHPEIHFTDVPKHMANGYLRYTLFQMLEVQFSGMYNSSRISTSSGLYSADPFFTMDFSVVFRLQAIAMEAAIENMLDADFSYMEGYPAPGRRFMLGFRTTIK